MAQLTDLEKVRRNRTWQKRIRGLLLLIVFAIVVFAISMFVYHKGNLDIKTAVGDITAEMTTGAGYPTAIPSGKLLDIKTVDNALAIVADGNLYTYNATGRKLMDIQHGMINPTITVAGGYILVYDRGANKVMLFSRSGELQQITSDFAVYDADIARNGNFALASGSDKFLSRVIVYNSEGDTIYQCSFVDRPVIGVSLADDKEAMTVGLIDVRDGEYLSSLARYQFNSKDPSAKLELPGELLLSLDYHDGNVLRSILDGRVALFDNDFKEMGTYQFGERQLLHFQYNNDGKLLLHLRNNTGKQQENIILLDSHLKELCSIPVETGIEKIKLDSTAIYLARKDTIQLYNFTGEMMGAVPINGSIVFEPMNGTLYYTTPSELCAVDIQTIVPSAPIPTQKSVPSKTQDSWKNLKDELLGTKSSSQASESQVSESEGKG